MIKQKKLSNGLTVLKIPQTETEAVTVLVLVKVGSRYEKKALNGVSHFIEHLMFKGTPTRPDTLAISKELDKVGAEYNAFTSKDYTGYYIKINYENQELALDLLADMLFNSKFEKQEIDRERGVIIEEINMYEDNPLLYCDDLLEELLFQKKHPLGQLISGPKENIRNISRRQILNYRNNYYFPRNMVIAVAGRTNKQTDRLIDKYFNQKTTSRPRKQFQKFNSYQTQPQVLISSKKTEQVQFALGFEALPYKHKDLPALNLLNVILGANMSSRMFINIRERKGLCYFIRTSLSIYEDTGVFMVRAGLDKSRIKEATQAIWQELKLVIQTKVSKEELDKAKNYLKGKFALDLEDSAAQASWFAKQKLLLNELKTPQQKLREYEKVSAVDIQRIARRIFTPTKANLVLIGPFKPKAEKVYKKLISKWNL